MGSNIERKIKWDKMLEKNEIDPIITLKTIYRLLDNLEYECNSSVYTLDDDEMSWIFHCRDLAYECIRNQR